MKTKLQIIQAIIRLRLSQLLVNERYKNGDFKIPIHLALGYESIAVAVDRSMRKNDCLISTHRNIHYNLARLTTLKAEMDEYYLKPTGLASGHLGSMNLSNPEKNVVYSSSILGNNFSVAAGYALGNKMKTNNGVVFIATGDGAIEEGSFYESLVFMKSNNLKNVLIVENNQWSLGTQIAERRCNIDLERLASSVGIEYLSMSGNDPFKYIDQIRAYRRKVVKTSSPVLLEVKLTALGYWFMETSENPEGKFINYHAGVAPTVEIEEYPLIASSNEDPLFVVKEFLSDKELVDISKTILEGLKAELR